MKIKKYTFKSPLKNKVAIFDGCGEEILSKAVLKDIGYSVIYNRGEKVYLHPKIIIIMMYLIVRGRTGLRLKLAYWISCLIVIKPSYVITFIDNYPPFYELAKYYNSAQFFAIQNGIRLIPCIQGLDGPVTLFSYGKNEKDIFQQLNMKDIYVAPVGSIKASYAMEIFKQNKMKYDICIVSDFCQSTDRRLDMPIWYEIAKTVYENLSHYLKDKPHLTCVIAGRGGKQSDYEKVFFQKYFDLKSNQFTYIKNNFLSTYQNILSSHVTVVAISSIGREALSMNRKVLYCNHLMDKTCVTTPVKGQTQISFDELIINGLDKETFKNRMDELLKIPVEKYLENTRKQRHYLNAYTPEKPSHQLVREAIMYCF